MLAVTRELCVAGHLLREEEESMYVIDPYNVEPHGPGSEQEVPVRMVSFKASGKFHWLEQALGLEKQWFKRNCVRVEFLNEILQLIRAKKPARGAQARLPRQQDCLVALQVRGPSGEQDPEEKVFWFRNDPRFVSVVVKPGAEGLKDFQWFLQELAFSIKSLQENEEETKKHGKKARQNPLPEALQAMVDDAVAAFMQHPRCASARYFPSRNEIVICRKDEVPSARFRIKKLQKHLEKLDWDALLRAFGDAEHKGLEFLKADPADLLPAPASEEGRGSSDEPEEGSQVSSEFPMPKNFIEVGDRSFRHCPIPPPGSGSSSSGPVPEIMSRSSSGQPASASVEPGPARSSSSSGSLSSCLVDKIDESPVAAEGPDVATPVMQWHAEWGPAAPAQDAEPAQYAQT